MEKTFSQKVARAFEIADYVLLIPAAFGVILATFLIGGAPWFTFLIYGTFILGCVLLVGYFKHSRGRLDEKHISSLWITTAIYNAVLLLPYLFYAIFLFQSLSLNNSVPSDAWKALALNLVIIFGYVTAISLSIKAYFFERNQKYR